MSFVPVDIELLEEMRWSCSLFLNVKNVVTFVGAKENEKMADLPKSRIEPAERGGGVHSIWGKNSGRGGVKNTCNS